MTQKYDKVVWQDETTSQQGTLINAERLDQMQTAHHYADGFEEVDEVPTEDPGVDYHKVVYCTADTTFYRWNGEEWTKDVDDDTKALLLAHEADHANPHVVTKAQVGLGNCDNTSDLDKPVSTATQTALDDKVTIIPVTSGVKFYSQSSGGTSLYQGTSSPVTGITSVPMRDSSGRIKTAAPSANDDAANKKYVDDADALKLNTSTLVGAWQGTPDNAHIPSEKLVKDTLDTKAAVATTLAGYGITDAYDKSQVDTLLAGKLDDSQLKTSWSSPVSDANIPSEKLTKDTLDAKVDDTQIVATWSGTPTDTNIPSEKLVKDSLGDGSVTKVGTATLGGNLKPIYLNAGVPTAVANDLVDVASAQTIAGAKTFTDTTTFKRDDNNVILANPNYTKGTLPSANKYNGILFRGSTSDTQGWISHVYKTDGSGEIQLRTYNYTTVNFKQLSIFSNTDGTGYMTGPSRAYNASNTSDVATIGTLDAYTPMVRTSGNQTIAGNKTFSNTMRIDGAREVILNATNAAQGLVLENTIDERDTIPVSNITYPTLRFNDKNDALTGQLELVHKSTGGFLLQVRMRDSLGNDQYITIAETS